MQITKHVNPTKKRLNKMKTNDDSENHSSSMHFIYDVTEHTKRKLKYSY